MCFYSFRCGCMFVVGREQLVAYKAPLLCAATTALTLRILVSFVHPPMHNDTQFDAVSPCSPTLFAVVIQPVVLLRLPQSIASCL